MRLGALGNPRGDGGGQHSCADAGDNTSDDELPESPMRSKTETGDDGSDDHPDRTDPHHLESTQTVSNEERQDGTTESSGFVNSCRDAKKLLIRRVVDLNALL